jgi:hypothetical protein
MRLRECVRVREHVRPCEGACIRACIAHRHVCAEVRRSAHSSACVHTSAEPRAHVCSHELLEWQRTFEPPLTHHLVSHEDCADAIVHGKRTRASVWIRECESDVIVCV